MWLFVGSAAIWLLALGRAVINLWDQRGLLVIHFDSFQGIDFFGNRGDVYEILGVGAVVLVLNLAIANTFYFRERFLSYLVAAGTLLFSLLILMAINVIISVN